MFQYPNAASGLKKIFTSQILAIVGAVMMILPPINIIDLIIALVAVVLDFIGVLEASKDDDGYRKALSYTIAQFIASLILIFLPNGNVVYRLVELAGSVFGLMVLYHICHTTSKLLRLQHANDIASQGDRVWNINIKCLIITAVCTFLCFIPFINIIAVPVLLVTAIVNIYACILYIIFIYNSYRRLETPFFIDY